MSEMVERVARAIALCHRWGPDADSKDQMRMRERVWQKEWPDDDVPFFREDGSTNISLGRNHYRNVARAALEAMREPSDPMKTKRDASGYDTVSDMTLGYWQAMIDAALKD